MFWTRGAYPLRGQVEGGWALKIESFWALWNGIEPKLILSIICYICDEKKYLFVDLRKF